MTKSRHDRQSDPISFRIPRRELILYKQEAARLKLNMTEFILAALRDKYFPNGHNDEEWYGHA